MSKWFGPKKYYDTGIINWQGFAATAIFLAAFFGLMHFFEPARLGLPFWARPAAIGLLILSFLILVYFKYEWDDTE